MNILAFDTSTSACSVALYVETAPANGQTYSVHELTPMQHTSVILPMIQSLLDSAGVKLDELDAIAFGCGPGSFTGIRIAASLAQGLAFAASLPVIPVSSLAAAAQAAYMQHGWQQILVAVDARMGQIYWGAYQVENSQVFPLIVDEISAADGVSRVADNGFAAIGDGWCVYGDALVRRLGWQPSHTDFDAVPTAQALLVLAKERYQRKDWVGADMALPVYLR